MTPSVLKFAKAVDTDLASAATLAGATLRIFNLDAEDTERAVSTMTMGCNASALSFEYLNTAMSIVGPVANSFGFTIEETTALLGLWQTAVSTLHRQRRQHVIFCLTWLTVAVNLHLPLVVL